MEPPPHLQHMALAVKSSSSVKAGVRHIAGVRPGEAQLIIVMLMAPLSVSMHGGGGDAGGGSGGDGGGEGNGHEQTQLALEPLQPDEEVGFTLVLK